MPLTTPTSIASITQSHRRITLDGGSSKGSTSEWDCRIRHCHSNDLSLLLQVSSIRPSASQFAFSARLRRDTTAAPELILVVTPSHPPADKPISMHKPTLPTQGLPVSIEEPRSPMCFRTVSFPHAEGCNRAETPGYAENGRESSRSALRLPSTGSEDMGGDGPSQLLEYRPVVLQYRRKQVR